MYIKLNPLIIGGKKYFNVVTFAAIVGKTPQTVYDGVKKGKLESINGMGKKLIPASELAKFGINYEE